jgi:hypothetical protein
MTKHSTPPFVVFAFVLSSACVQAPPTPPAGDPVTYAAYLEPVVLERCLACHTADEPKAELVLEPGVGYDNLVNRSSIQVPGMALVKPGDPEASYLWLKVDQRPVEGDGMPRTLFGARRLPEPEVELFRRWIADGALP